MEKALVEKIKNRANFLIIFSITALILTNLLPWISITDQDDAGQTQYFNYDMIRKSDVANVFEFTSVIGYIFLILLVMVVFSMLSFLGTIFYVSKKLRMLSILMMFSGGLVLIFGVIATLSFFAFLEIVRNSQTVDLAFVAEPISYSVFPFLFILLSILVSTTLSISVINFLLDFVFDKKKKTSKKRNIEKSDFKLEKEIMKDKKPVSKTLAHTQKMKTEDWSEDEGEDIELEIKRKIQKPKGKIEKTEIREEQIEDFPKIDISKDEEAIEEETFIEPVNEKEEKIEVLEVVSKVEEKQDEKVEKEKPKIDDSFEKALSSAIERKKKEKNKTVEKKPLAKEDKKKFKVRCKHCKNEFTAEISGDAKKIKCPKCGEEGSIK